MPKHNLVSKSFLLNSSIFLFILFWNLFSAENYFKNSRNLDNKLGNFWKFVAITKKLVWTLRSLWNSNLLISMYICFSRSGNNSNFLPSPKATTEQNYNPSLDKWPETIMWVRKREILRIFFLILFFIIFLWYIIVIIMQTFIVVQSQKPKSVIHKRKGQKHDWNYQKAMEEPPGGALILTALLGLPIPPSCP